MKYLFTITQDGYCNTTDMRCLEFFFLTRIVSVIFHFLNMQYYYVQHDTSILVHSQLLYREGRSCRVNTLGYTLLPLRNYKIISARPLITLDENT